VSQALARLRSHGVPVFKDIGPCESPIPISDWEKQRGVGVSVVGTESELHPGYAELLEQIAFVQDPVSLSLLPESDHLGGHMFSRSMRSLPLEPNELINSSSRMGISLN
jgi:hypothetical protein